MNKLNGKSLNLTNENIERLKALFPESYKDGTFDFNRIKQLVGHEYEEMKENYRFTWYGKQQAVKEALKQSKGTLIPNKERSFNFDKTNNIYIEGDNLEVLKLLQASYRNKVNMIYIDPPYNTGKDFIYKDNYGDNLHSYIENTDQNLLSNPETSGRYHTVWLNMMYPRLMLAKNLMSDDGVIFISIDSNEMINLKSICDEIYGENNLLGIISVVNNLKGRSDDKFFATCNEYLLAYARNVSFCCITGFNLDEEELDQGYTEKDEIGFYKLIGLRKTGKGWERVHRPYMYYPILYKDNSFKTITEDEYHLIYDKKTKSFNDTFVKELETKYKALGYAFHLPLDSNGNKGRWRWGLETFLKEKNINVEYNSANTICSKMRATIEDGSIRMKSAKTLWYKPEYDTGNGGKVLKQLFKNSSDLFENPKSLTFIKDILNISTKKDALILDFFSGSGTTAHALMQLNVEDEGNRRYIMVQLPEKTDETSLAYQSSYHDICQLGQERIKRAGKKIKNDYGEKANHLDIGFKVFKLYTSNFKVWNETMITEETLLNYSDNILKNRTHLDLVYEILLKYGLDLTKKMKEILINGKSIYNIEDNYLFICLDQEIDAEVILEIGKLHPERVVFYDEGFKDDSVKLNAEQTLKRFGITDIRVI